MILLNIITFVLKNQKKQRLVFVPKVDLHGVLYWCSKALTLTLFRLETHVGDPGKQCRPCSDATECGI